MAKGPIESGSVQYEAGRHVLEKLAMSTDVRPEDSDEMVHARVSARHGDPLPLLLMLWPELEATDEETEQLGHRVRLDTFQLDMISCVLSDSAADKHYAEVAIKGAAGVGKGASTGLAAVCWYYLHQDGIVVITSASHDHAAKVMWSEVRKWIEKSAVPIPGKLLKQQLDGSGNRYIKVANPESDEGFSGHHSQHVMFIFDEATSVADSRYDLAKTQAHKIVSLANPRVLSGWFRRLFPGSAPQRDKTQDIETEMGLRRCISIDGKDCVNVRTGQELLPGQLTKNRYNALAGHEDKRFANIFAHGKFPEEDVELQVILGSWLERHQSAWHEAWRDQKGVPVEAFGLDVAASSHGDQTCLAPGGHRGIAQLHLWRREDTMQTVAWVMGIARDQYEVDLSVGQDPICVDTDGLGKGVADRLQELGCWVIRHVGNGTAEQSRQYVNMRAESYGELGRRLDPEGPWPDDEWVLPPDNMLAEELAAPEKMFTSDGIRYKITPKERKGPGDVETLRMKLGRSPDRSDAVVMLYAAVRHLETFTMRDTSHVTVAYNVDPVRRGRTAEQIAEEEARMHPAVKNLMEFYSGKRQSSKRAPTEESMDATTNRVLRQRGYW